LSVALGSKSTTFQQGLSEEDATAIDVGSSINIVKCVCDTIQGTPELLVENVLRVLANTVSHCHDMALEVWVHRLHSRSSTLTLQLSHILWSEEELSVQITLFDRVHIRHADLSIWSGRKTNHSPILQHFATNSTCTNEELLDVGQFLLEFSTEDDDLAIISRVQGLAQVLGSRRVVG